MVERYFESFICKIGALAGDGGLINKRLINFAAAISLSFSSLGISGYVPISKLKRHKK